MIIQNAVSPGQEFQGLFGPNGKLIVTPAEIKKPRIKRTHVIRYFDYEAEKKLLSHVTSLKGKRPARDKMIMELGFGLGLRVAEISGLTVGAVRNREDVTIVGKGLKHCEQGTICEGRSAFPYPVPCAGAHCWMRP